MVDFHILSLVDIEYIGDPPVIDEIMKYRMAIGEIPADSAAVIRGAEQIRCTAVKGIDRRVVDPEWFGTSQKYVFGPDDYIVGVEPEDVDKILGSASGHQFRRVGDPLNEIYLPRQPFRFVDGVDIGGSDGAKMKFSDLQKLYSSS